MTSDAALDRQVPSGFSDLFLDEAARQIWLGDTLRDLFYRWGYAPVIPPTVAYAEDLPTETVAGVYRFLDREGHALALRADLTLPVARIAGTRLYDQELPLRLCYVERVFRHIAPQAGKRREFTQAGVELIGADTPEADAEVVALAAEALRSIGIPDIHLAVGQMAFFGALLGELALPRAHVVRLKEAIDRRNDALLDAVLGEIGVPPELHALLRALPSLSGKRDVLERARQITPLDAAHHALDRLDAVIEILEAYGLTDQVLVDLGEVRGMDYYTGLVFEGYASGVGHALCSGGRYDGLVGRFGPDLPAVGFGIDVGLVRLAVEPPVHLAPDLVVQRCAHRACHDAVCALRARGMRVIVDVADRCDHELIAYAHRRGARAALCAAAGTWEIVAPDSTRHRTSTQALLEGH
ncbi:MAG: ATP phosphoribosyltransferase regulatory subunit [Anaerolineae bacterium]|nr:ATP phosphoribosyltransferase regulatory subunit [Anaerolineae bacterium]